MSYSAFMCVTLLTPDRLVLEDYPATSLAIPGEEGELGLFPRHTPLLVTLKAGVVMIHAETETLRYSISDGFADILPDRVTLLVSKAQALLKAENYSTVNKVLDLL
ncbi:MAG: F0F1 ATP synthase subunit epsilon [Alphaproteobacteria bacterium]